MDDVIMIGEEDDEDFEFEDDFEDEFEDDLDEDGFLEDEDEEAAAGNLTATSGSCMLWFRLHPNHPVHPGQSCCYCCCLRLEWPCLAAEIHSNSSTALLVLLLLFYWSGNTSNNAAGQHELKPC